MLQMGNSMSKGTDSKKYIVYLAIAVCISSLKFVKSPFTFCFYNQAGHYGALRGSRPFPHVLCFSSSLKYLDNSIWCTFPKLFYRNKNPTKWKMLTTWWHWPQVYWSLRIDHVNPCDTTLLPQHQSIRELCTSWLYTLWHPLTWPLKMLCWTVYNSQDMEAT